LTVIVGVVVLDLPSIVRTSLTLAVSCRSR
jgi:hypothetical protein